MDSVYDAALTHAEKLKAELETLQTFLNLHDHFRDRFGLTSAATSAAAPSEASPLETETETETVVGDHAGATHDIHVQEEPHAEAKDAVEAHAPEAGASPPQDSEHGASLQAEAAPEGEEEPRVIKASEGVLIATPDAAETEPLGPEATLQSVAEKLAATIGASHSSVTGYTV
jgi:hypothetical protein